MKRESIRRALVVVLALACTSLGIATGVNAEQRDDDITRHELTKFDQFLDSHVAIARDLRRDPNLANSREYLEDHRDLRDFLNAHPGVREELREDPNYFVYREERFQASGGDISRQELAEFDEFLDRHPWIGREVKADPTLVNNRDYLEDHFELREFFANHPRLRDELREHPRLFVERERRFQATGQDITRWQLVEFNEFLDRHPYIGRELRADPSLINNPAYLRDRAELREFLSEHPRLRDELREHPHAFVDRAAYLDRR